MKLQDIKIRSYSLKEVSLIAGIIRESVSLTGKEVLRHLSDEEVVNLWQYALQQARDLSSLNKQRGLQEIVYPHLWAKKYLFKVFGDWQQCESDAMHLLTKLKTSPKETVTSSDTTSNSKTNITDHEAVSSSRECNASPVRNQPSAFLSSPNSLEEYRQTIARQYQMPSLRKRFSKQED